MGQNPADYCDAPPPRPTWAEHKSKLDRLRADDELTRGVPRRRKKKHLAQARAAAAAAPPPRARTGARRSQRAPPVNEVDSRLNVSLACSKTPFLDIFLE